MTLGQANPMRATILCPGPSLSAYKPEDRGPMVLAVNRAALAHACDWWVALDYPMIRDNVAKVDAAIVTRRQTHIDLKGRIDARRVVHTEDIGATIDPALGWTTYSHTSAIAFAYWYGMSGADVYGADMAGVTDFDGVAAGENRSDDRWSIERGILAVLLPWLNQRHFTVKYHGHF